MLKNVGRRLRAWNPEPPSLPESPSGEDIQQLLDSGNYTEPGSFKRVYETDQKAVKLPRSPRHLHNAGPQIQMAEDSGIGPETDLYTFDLTSNGYLTETPVVIQDRFDYGFDDILAEEVDLFLDEVTHIIDTALENNLVLDVKPANFGSFDNQIKYIDITDRESILSFPAVEERTPTEKRNFVGAIRFMYKDLVNKTTRNTDYSKQEVIDHTTYRSAYLDPDVEIELPEDSPHIGLEQRLPPELTGLTENSIKAL